jgi:molybdopterin-guanine dinucleotide biosynthesis protein A
LKGSSVQVDGLILAGGQGIRMGGVDKAFLTLGGETLIARSIRRLGPQLRHLAVSANGDARRFAALGIPVLADHEILGPLSGLLAGLDWAANQGADAIISVAVDTPFFPGDLVARLRNDAEDRAGIANCLGRDHPAFGLWPVSIREELRLTLARGERRLMRFADAIGAVRVTFPAHDPDPFWNLNTRADLELAQRAMPL